MKIDDAVIDKVLNNKASAEDARQVSEWFATEEGHDYLSKRMDGEMLSLTEGEVENWVPHAIPEEKMKQRFLQQIKPRRRVNSYRRWWAAAVLIPFIFLCGSVWFLADKVGLFSETEYAELVVPCGEQMRVVLQDGTIVQLNSDTRLKYPKKFGIFTRTVELWGEGYFEVMRNPEKPFVVQSEVMQVRVLGTVFNLKSDKAKMSAVATLLKGEVEVKGNHGEGMIILAPGQKAELNGMTRRLVVKQVDTGIENWHNNEFVFEKADLYTIARTLENSYGVRVILAPNIDVSKTYSGTLKKKESVGAVLNLIKNAIPLEYKIVGNSVFLSSMK